MTRFFPALLFAGGISLSLFWLMHTLISQQAPALVNENDTRRLVEFVRLKRDEQAPETRKRQPPKPPPEPLKKPPPPAQVLSAVKAPSAPTPQMNMPKLDLPLQLGGITGGLVVGRADQTNSDGDMMPLVRIAPQYPMRAAMDGVEGWVKVEFTVNERGEVEDAKVLEAKPRRVFNREALRAIRKWRFKPRVVDGKPIKHRAVQTIDFKLDK